MNKKASIADLGVIAFTIIVLAAIFSGAIVDGDNVDQIGSYQNEILDSYTVAEGSRFYLQRAVEYSAESATDLGCNFDLQQFRDKFSLYLDSLYVRGEFPAQNMGLTFENLALKGYESTFEDNLLTITFHEPLLVTNKGTFNNDRFEIETQLNSDIIYEIDCEPGTLIGEDDAFPDLELPPDDA